MSDIKLAVDERDEDSTYWTLKVPAVQSFFDLEIKGWFSHFKDRPKASYWEIESKGYSNGQEIPQDEFLKLLGNGVIERAEEHLETILSGPMENDYDDWVLWNEAVDRDAKSEAALNNAYYQKVTGF